MEKGSPVADLPLFAVTLCRPTAQAVARIGWPLPPPHPATPCLLALHAGQGYDFRAARRVEHQSGHTMPSPKQASVGVIGVGRWDGQRLVDVQPIEPVFAKGHLGFWRLSSEDEMLVRERYAAALAGQGKRPISGGTSYDWSNN